MPIPGRAQIGSTRQTGARKNIFQKMSTFVGFCIEGMHGVTLIVTEEEVRGEGGGNLSSNPGFTFQIVFMPLGKA